MSGSSPASDEQDEAPTADLEQELFSPEGMSACCAGQPVRQYGLALIHCQLAEDGLEDAEAPGRSE